MRGVSWENGAVVGPAGLFERRIFDWLWRFTSGARALGKDHARCIATLTGCGQSSARG